MALATACSASSVAAEKQDHVHLALRVVIAPNPPMPAGDVLGLYAVEVLACPAPKAAMDVRATVLAWLDRATNVLVSPALASHRDHFDRPGARMVPTRLVLDRGATYPLGAVVVPSGTYCQVRLTLTRLPSVAKPNALPALNTSVRLTRPGALPPLALGYPVALELPFAKPWQVGHGQAQLTMTLNPASAMPVLADATLGEGSLMRQIVARWVATSSLSLTSVR